MEQGNWYTKYYNKKMLNDFKNSNKFLQIKNKINENTVKSKIKKVIYAIDDIDHRTSKKAYSLLKSNKIIVKKNLFKNKANKLYKKYFYHKKNKLPYVIGKIACSKDKFIYSNKKSITKKLVN